MFVPFVTHSCCFSCFCDLPAITNVKILQRQLAKIIPAFLLESVFSTFRKTGISLKNVINIGTSSSGANSISYGQTSYKPVDLLVLIFSMHIRVSNFVKYAFMSSLSMFIHTTEVLLVIIVGAFLVTRARIIPVVSFFLFLFFIRPQSHSDWSIFLTIETTRTTKAIRPSPISGNESHFSYFTFLTSPTKPDETKGSPLLIFLAFCDFFSKIFQGLKRVPLSSFLIFCNRIYDNKAQRVPLFTFFGTMLHFPTEKNFKNFKFFTEKMLSTF